MYAQAWSSMRGAGFEPAKGTKPQDLKSCPFGHSGTPSNDASAAFALIV